MIKGRGASAPRFLFSVELIGDTGKIGAGEENLSLERFPLPSPNKVPYIPQQARTLLRQLVRLIL